MFVREMLVCSVHAKRPLEANENDKKELVEVKWEMLLSCILRVGPTWCSDCRIAPLF